MNFITQVQDMKINLNYVNIDVFDLVVNNYECDFYDLEESNNF